MADVVVDASVWVSLLSGGDRNHEPTVRWFRRRIEEVGLLVAPILVIAEVAGAVSRVTRSPAVAHRGVATIRRLSAVRLLSVESRLGERAASLAADLRLRGADAVYVAMAERLRVPLITWDAEQRAGASRVVATAAPE